MSRKRHMWHFAPALNGGCKVVYPSGRTDTVDDYIEISVNEDGQVVLRGFDGRLVVRADVSNKLFIELEKF